LNIHEILSENEQILYEGQQHRIVPGGKEILPGRIAVTDQRIILQTTSFLGLKKDFEDLHYSDVESIGLHKNVFSSDLILHARFHGEIRIKAIGKDDAIRLERIINRLMNQYRFGYGGNQNRL